MQIISVLLLLLFVTSCGKTDSSAGVPSVKNVQSVPLNRSSTSDLYLAKFYTLNSNVNGLLPGSATVHKKGKDLYAYVRLFGGSPKAWHQQFIHEGGRCPNMADDLNRDNYIDIQEGNKVWGKVLIPLDSNLNSQKEGRNVFPMADETGTYFYERVANFNELFQDLRSEDKDPNDSLTKLLPTEDLSIEGKVVVIYGTADTVPYPATVASADNRPVHQTLPIACGVFTRVDDIPGEFETPEEVPAPRTRSTEPTRPTPRPPERETPREGTTTTEESTSWIERRIERWRARWSRDRGDRPTGWGDGAGSSVNN
jgi:hypothetical protein